MSKKTSKKEIKQNQKKSIITNISYKNELVIWTFDNIDKSGEFAFDIERNDFNLKSVFDKMIQYSTMTWSVIESATHDNGRSKHHFISINSLSKEARKRISFKRFDKEDDDCTDRIFSFALENKLRIIGIRDRNIFHVVWYDPKHEFCPSHKKNT